MDKRLRLSLLFQASGNTKGFLGGLRGDADKTGKALAAARQRVQQLQRTSRDVAAYKAQQQGLEGTRARLAAAREEARRLALANTAAERPTRQLTRAFEVARRRVNELTTEEQRRRRGLQDLRVRLSEAGVSTRNLTANEMRLARQTREANEELAQQSRRLDQLRDRQARMGAARGRYDRAQQFAGSARGAGTSALGAAAVVGAPLVLTGREAVGFEDAMLDVRKVVDFDTPEQFRQMRGDILDLSVALNLPAEGIAGIVAAAGQARIAREELRTFAQDAGTMGVAFDSTAEDAGRMMATWRTAFAMTQDQVRGFADQINYLGDNGNASALAISNVVTRVGPLAGVAGAAAAEVAALGSAIVGMGVEEEVAATGIKNTMLALTRGESATRRQRDAYRALGLEAGAVARAMQADAGGTILDVLERIRRLSPDRQASILSQLFGTESVGAIAPVLTQLDVLRGNLAAVGDASLTAGSMQREFENRSSGAAFALGQMSQGAKAAAVAVGDTMLPTIRAGAQMFARAAAGIRRFAEAHPGLTKAAGGLLAVLAIGLAIFGGLALAVAAVVGPFALMNLALAGAAPVFAALTGGIAAASGAVWSFTAALLANPITWIVLAVVALAAGAYLIYRNWGAVSAWFGSLWEAIKLNVSSALNFIGGLIMNFSPVGMLVNAFTRAWPALQGLIPRFLEMGRNLLRGMIDGVLGGVPALLRAVWNAAGDIINKFKERLGIRSPSRVFAQLGDFTMQGLGAGISRSADEPMGRMRQAASALAAAGVVGLSAGAADVQFDSGPRIQADAAAGRGAGGAGGGGRSGVTIGTLTIQIVQQPGQNAEDLAREVARILQSPNLSRLGDGAADYGTD